VDIAVTDKEVRTPDDSPEIVEPVRRVESREVVEAAYRRHYRDVYRYAITLTRSSDEAEEIVSEAFERALQHWRSAPPAPLAWLLLTARRIATDRWRRARRLARALRSTTGGETSASVSDFWIWFDAVGRILTEGQREVLTLRYQRDLTDADIAEIMGLTESGVRSLIARALQAIRTHEELL
jgi:RNA polymerase sigma-70 factor (ECF subfamily)